MYLSNIAFGSFQTVEISFLVWFSCCFFIRFSCISVWIRKWRRRLVTRKLRIFDLFTSPINFNCHSRWKDISFRKMYSTFQKKKRRLFLSNCLLFNKWFPRMWLSYLIIFWLIVPSINRSLLPLVLAQLLIQFQKPIVSDNSVQNTTISSINDTLTVQLNSSTTTPIIQRNIRSVHYNEDAINNLIDFHKIEKRFVAEHSSNGNRKKNSKNSLQSRISYDCYKSVSVFIASF